MKRLFLACLFLPLLSGTVSAASPEPLSARAEVNVRAGSERSILMNEFWVPFMQDAARGSVLYGDLRLMGDDHDNREFNAGIGYRQMVNGTGIPFFDEGVIGVHGWADRRFTDTGSRFNQITAGAEWMGKTLDLKLNGYLPLNRDKSYTIANPNPTSGFVGNQLVISTDRTVVEEAMHGVDFEVGFNVLDVAANFTDHDTGLESARLYAGGYHFAGDRVEDVSGWRVRAAMDVTSDMQVGARFQRDDVRGSQSFLEATIRFPFGNKGSQRRQGLYGRLDESPERDIDIVAATAVTNPGVNTPLINAATGQPQNIIHVDNTSGGGDGSAENPYNTLLAAQGAAGPNDMIYVHAGTGTDAGQNAGITLSQSGQMLVGSGTNLVYDGSRFTTANGQAISTQTLIAATTAPVISNAGANAVTVTADNVYLAGFTARDSQNGIVVDANATSAQNITITDVSAINNDRMGIYLHGYNNGSLSAKVQRTITGSNGWHGMAVYDDTASTFDVDLGGGSLGSVGRNTLANNTLEDLAVDYDGRALSAMNNWWGQASGPDQDDPGVGIAPQIYYGAPINDGLVGHWTFDSEWTSNTTAYDRSGQNNNGTLDATQSLADLTTGQNGEALTFTSDRVSAGDINDIDGTTEFSVSGWIKLDGTNSDDDILFKGNHSLNNPIEIWRDDAVSGGDQAGNFNTLSVYVYDGTHQTWISAPTDSLNDTNWHHIAVTYKALDAAGINIYIDGVHQQSGSTALIDFVQSSANQITLGAPSDNIHYFDGLLDDQMLYVKSLTAPEVAELYRQDTTSTVTFTGFTTSAP